MTEDNNKEYKRLLNLNNDNENKAKLYKSQSDNYKKKIEDYKNHMLSLRNGSFFD
jgi:hypothetical protein